MSRDGLDGPRRRVRVVIGPLDRRGLQELRTWLKAWAARPDTVVEIDLSQTDHRHPLRLFALLAEAAHLARVSGNDIVVLHPPDTMVASLTAVGLHVRRHGPIDPAAGEVVRIPSEQLSAPGLSSSDCANAARYQRVVLDPG